MIPDAEVELVRDSADIVGVIGDYVELKKQGTDFRGPCPFHQGTHRNFSVSPAKRMYYCFVCHEGGDVFNFLQKRLGMEWPEAVRLVAARSGIELHEITRRSDGPDPRTALWEASAAAAEYFARMLWNDPAGRAAREYLAQRDVPRELAEQFSMGFAPREIGLMRAHLLGMGIPDEVMLNAGLLVRQSEELEPRPRFRQRLTFPIYDASGHCVAFGGRLLGPGEPKYLNSAESPVFAKGQTLYHLHAARNAARRDDRLFIVEGYFDVLRMVGAGIEHVVAPMGTALTAEQAQLIVRYTKNVFLVYDSDPAGLKATFRSGDALLSVGASVRVVSLPDGEDPDTFVRARGRAGLEEQVAASMDVFERKIQILERGGWFKDLIRRRKAIDHLLPTLRATSDALTRELYFSRAAEVSGVDRRVLEAEVASPGRAARPQQPARLPERAAPASLEPADAPPPPRPRRFRKGPGWSAERELVRCMLGMRSMVERVAERIGPENFDDPRFRQIFATLLERGSDATAQELAEDLPPETVEILQEILSEPDAVLHFERTVEDSLVRLQLRGHAERNQEIDRLAPMATGEEKDRLVQEKMANQQEINRLRNSIELQ